MKKIYSLIMIAALFGTMSVSAQQSEQRLTPALMARLFPAGVVSPDYNKDGSVTL